MKAAPPALAASRSQSRWANLLGVFLTISFPILAVLIAVRLVMTPLFLQIEYYRPGFPVDAYGFTVEDRMRYAPYALDYLLNGEDIDFLGDLTFPDGSSLYNVRELHHMRDVKIVTQIAFAIAIGLGVLNLIGALLLIRPHHTRETFRRAMRNGGLLTLIIIFAIVVVAIVNWNFFFTTFHEIFFAEGTWMFLYSDTLIRLFPEQFWFDAAITIGVLAVLFSFITIAVGHFARPR